MIREQLFLLADNDYKKFTSKLVFTNRKIIGVRLPKLRTLARTINCKEYLNETHNYFEEIMLEGMVIGNIKNIDDAFIYMEKFIPKIDNWSICDSFCCSLKITKKNYNKMFDYIIKYKSSKKEFERRFLLVMLLNYYIDDNYIDEIFKIISEINKEEYYVKMAIAWLISICYIKQEFKTKVYLNNNNLDNFTFNKTISKICDSYRVSKEDKQELKKLRK